MTSFSFELFELSHAVISKLLEGDDVVLDQLRDQFAAIELQQLRVSATGYTMEFNFLQQAIPVANTAPFQIGDVVADLPGLRYGAGFTLHVNGGMLSYFEGYSYEEPWPPRVQQFELSFNESLRDPNFVRKT